ncbi:hypothetical protein [Corynebacterium phocae]|uniref:phage tail tube protein n=1 Tax=Corynebacterium phocae TaxID=161895 RepID=UPI00095194B8|nr:hypothetical protein [Corynebacterium phocae]KAA8723583.1 hypothetical protein F4V58_06575 [Corynebacterium phocae]
MAFEVDLQQPNYNELLTYLGVTGAVTYAPLSADIPEGMDNYAAPFVPVGWISDEGITESTSTENESFTPWQTNSPVREATTSQEFTFSFTLWTVGGLATALRYGVAESDMRWDETGEFAEFSQGGALPKDFRFRLGIDILDGVKHRRFILPAASVSESSDVTYQKGDLTGYPLTVKANLDSKLGYSIMRRFKEGWKPGKAGTALGSGGETFDLGDWSTPVTEE